MTDGEKLARACAAAAADKKAEDITVLDMQGISTFTDYFVICSGSSEPQLKAIASSIREQCREKLDRKPASEDGFPISQWIVLDYGDVIVHLFHNDKREFYGLENLWSDAKRLEVEGI
ncbi:MAG: ribosome silencing factor [Verrucomicrobia bacterium 61-8]|nr:ribosome silencing factor [Verrucomicrobiota bacterium]OJV13727.1 MAG: ribosome silencing factor [Verrucomicrobia bacterium 61-8]